MYTCNVCFVTSKGTTCKAHETARESHQLFLWQQHCIFEVGFQCEEAVEYSTENKEQK
jgi:hypothetical protein